MNDQLCGAFILYLERVAHLFALFDLAEVVLALLHRNLRSGGLGHCFWQSVLRRGLREGGEGERDDQRKQRDYGGESSISFSVQIVGSDIYWHMSLRKFRFVFRAACGRLDQVWLRGSHAE